MARLYHLCLGASAFTLLTVGLLWGPSSVLAAPGGPQEGHEEKACATIHKIALGENLTWIAAEHGISVEELTEANGIEDANLIVENQALCIPEKHGENNNGGKRDSRGQSDEWDSYGVPGHSYDPSLMNGQENGGSQERNSGKQENGYGEQERNSGRPENGYGDQNGYDDHENGHGDQRNGYGDQRNGYGDQRNGYGDQENGHNDQERGYGDQERGYGDQENGYGDQENGYGDQENGYHVPGKADEPSVTHEEPQRDNGYWKDDLHYPRSDTNDIDPSDSDEPEPSLDPVLPPTTEENGG